MSIEWIILIATVIILWLVIKAALKMVMISFNTVLQIFIILVVLRVFFTIMPQDVLQQIREMPQLVRNLI
ncbi:MAG: hypothetical protein GVY17_11715 [Cyanobacteria bacterium]|jgi:hypothetical protein|nr:hypothetical protein [Cyanobacteria bacterium GSL.Bin21]